MSATGRVYRRCRKDCPRACRKHRWAYSLELPQIAGRRQHLTKSGYDTKAEAQTALDALREKLRKSGRIGDERRDTVAVYFDRWLARKAELENRRASTLRSYQQHIDHYIVPVIGSVKMAHLKPEHIEAVLRKVRREGAQHTRYKLPEPRVNKRQFRAAQRGASDATVQRVFATLRSALRAAEKRGVIPFDPCRVVEVATPDTPEIEPWEPHEAVAFLQHMEGDRLYALWVLAMDVGMRRGELCGLRWQDVDFDNGLIHVRQQALQHRQTVTFGPPKSTKSKRVDVPGNYTLDQLKRHQIAQGVEKLQWGDDYTDLDLVFANEDGSPLRPDTLTGLLPRLCRKFNLRRVRFHDLRHMSGTAGQGAGESPFETMSRLGHTQLGTTERYVHPVKQRERDLANRRAAYLFGGLTEDGPTQ